MEHLFEVWSQNVCLFRVDISLRLRSVLLSEGVCNDLCWIFSLNVNVFGSVQQIFIFVCHVHLLVLFTLLRFLYDLLHAFIFIEAFTVALKTCLYFLIYVLELPDDH